MYHLPFEIIGFIFVCLALLGAVISFAVDDYKARSLDRLYARRDKADAKRKRAERQAQAAQDKVRALQTREYDRAMASRF